MKGRGLLTRAGLAPVLLGLALLARADAPAAAARDLVSDPQAVLQDDAAADTAGSGGRSRSLSSDRARSPVRPLPAPDPVRVLPPVVIPQINLPAGNGSAAAPWQAPLAPGAWPAAAAPAAPAAAPATPGP
ncbi:MAG: hypothetical protein KGI67_12345 [Pseudomonadota bacterium]|nr:hypothetical protein [Pseudomonadota bacterium]